MRAPRAPRASRWEIAGAWLHVWTPPRDVDVPPPPRRALAVVALLLVAAVAAVAVFVAPAIDRGKERTAAHAERSRAATRAAIRARLVVDQRAQTGRAPAVARLFAAGRREDALAALVATARFSVDRDVRARVAAGELPGPIRAVRCEPRARDRGARVRVDCLAVTAAITHRRVHRVRIGHPFVVGASLRDGRYAWCKDNRQPGEGSTGRTVRVPLPRACGD